MHGGTLLVLLVALLQDAYGQSSAQGPLGVLIRPPRRIVVTQAVRSALPPNVAVRLVRATALTQDGQQMVIYEGGDQYEPSSHLAVVRRGRRVADFGLATLFKGVGSADMCSFISASEFHSRDNIDAFVAAFRNIGDGAATLFMLVINVRSTYHVAWRQQVTQGSFRLKRDGTIQLWNATSDSQCVWCNHHYGVAVLEWKNSSLSTVNHWTTKSALDPGPISATPIVIEK